MKKNIIIFAVLVLCFNLIAGGAVIENPDKPLKGELDFNLQKVWQTENAGEDVMVGINSIQVDEEGNVYALTMEQAKIFVFGPDGKFRYAFGRKGEGPGEIKMAFRFFLIENRIIVPEMGKFSFFDLKGKFIKSINTGRMIAPLSFINADQFLHTGGFTSREKGTPENLYIFNIATRKDQIVTGIPHEEALTASSGGMRIMLKDSSTTPGIVLDLKDKNIFFGKSDKYLIKKIDLAGNEIFSFSLEGRKRKKISMAYKRKRFENIIVNGRKMPKEMIDRMIGSMPDEAPFFNRIMITANGLIYVFVSDLENETGREIDIFSPGGKYFFRGKIKMPDNYIIRSELTFKGDYLYLFAEDEAGDEKLLKFKITTPVQGIPATT